MPEIPLSFYYFGYVPNHTLNYVALAVFAVLFIASFIRVFFSATSPKFTLILPLTAALELAGFVIRYICSNNPSSDIFTAMTILLLISANLLVLLNYKAIGDVIRLSGIRETRYYIVGPNLAKGFYKATTLASIVTAVGGGIQADASEKTIGSVLTILGVVLQLVCFFILSLSMRYVDVCSDYQYMANNKKNPKNKMMRVMYATMILIIIRSLYRLVNYIILIISPTDVHEWTFYVFDALFVALILLIHCIWYIGKYFPSSLEEELNQKDKNDINDYSMLPLPQQQQPQYGQYAPPPPPSYNNGYNV